MNTEVVDISKPDAAGRRRFDIKKLFVAFLSAGFAGIVMGQSLDSVIIILAVPIGAMFLYLWFGHRVARASLLLDQFADSIYYMGFLFTLGSLVVSLISFQGDAIDVPKLVSIFALALVTTIIGLGSRVYITNFKQDVRSVRDSMAIELNQQADSMLRVVSQISERMESFSIQVTDVSQKMLRDSADKFTQSIQSIDELTQQAEKSVATSSQIAIKGMEKVVADFSQSINDIDIPVDLLSQKLSKPIENYVVRVDESSQLMAEMLVQQRSVRDNTRKVGESLSTIVAKISTLEAAFGQLEGSVQLNAKAHKETLSVIGDISEIASKTNELSEEIGLQIRSAKDVTTAVHGAVRELTSVSNAVNTVSSTVSEGVAGVSQTLDLAVNSIDQYTAKIKRQEDVLLSLEQSASKNMQLVKQHQRDMKLALDDSRDAVQTVSTHFVDAANYVSQRLRA